MSVIPLGPGSLAIAASLVIINGLLSIGLRLDLERKLAIASVHASGLRMVPRPIQRMTSGSAQIAAYAPRSSSFQRRSTSRSVESVCRF